MPYAKPHVVIALAWTKDQRAYPFRKKSGHSRPMSHIALDTPVALAVTNAHKSGHVQRWRLGHALG
jgi:hypothetical protein